MIPAAISENNSHIVFVGPEELTWRNLLHAVTRSKVGHKVMNTALTVDSE